MMEIGVIGLYVAKNSYEYDLISSVNLNNIYTVNFAIHSLKRLNSIFKQTAFKTTFIHNKDGYLPNIMKSTFLQESAEFWDCSCKFSFIQPSTFGVGYCKTCKRKEAEAPHSKVNEILNQYYYNFNRNYPIQVWLKNKIFFGGFNDEIDANNSIIEYLRLMAKLNNQGGELLIKYDNWSIYKNDESRANKQYA